MDTSTVPLFSKCWYYKCVPSYISNSMVSCFVWVYYGDVLTTICIQSHNWVGFPWECWWFSCWRCSTIEYL